MRSRPRQQRATWERWPCTREAGLVRSLVVMTRRRSRTGWRRARRPSGEEHQVPPDRGPVESPPSAGTVGSLAEPAWYHRGTDCCVRWVQKVHARGQAGRVGRDRTDRHTCGVGWGPSGRWFKSSRPDFWWSLLDADPVAAASSRRSRRPRVRTSAQPLSCGRSLRRPATAPARRRLRGGPTRGRSPRCRRA